MPQQNPYVVGNAVGNSPAFVGRTDILRKVKDVLNSQQNIIRLFGNRRIGKSSLLKELEAQLPKEGWGVIFFDLQSKAQWPLDEILKELAYAISFKLAKEEPDLPNPRRDLPIWLGNILKDLPTDKNGLVLLIDEFDVFAENLDNTGQAQDAFFPYLYDLLTLDTERLNFVFAIGRRRDDIRAVFAKASITIKVSLLSYEETKKIILFSESPKKLSWKKDAIERVWELTHGHPYLTQALCSEIWHAHYTETQKKAPKLTAQNVNDAIIETLNNSDGAIDWLWNGLEPIDRLVASALAAEGVGPISENNLSDSLNNSSVPIMIEEQKNATHLLQDWDLIEQPVEGAYCFRVELLRRWIAENKPLNEIQREWENLDQTAYRHYRIAKDHYEMGQLEAAESNVRQAVNKNADHINANVLLAEILLQKNKDDEACSVLERLYKKYQPPVIRSLLIQTWLRLANANANLETQLSFYNKVLKIEQNNQDAKTGIKNIWQNQADKAYRQGDLEKALNIYRKAGLKKKAAEVQAKIWQKQADEYFRQGNLEKALVLYQKAGKTDKVTEIQQMLNLGAVKELMLCLKGIVTESTNVINTIFLYDQVNHEVIYTTENDETQKLVDAILKHKFKNPETIITSLPETINDIGKKLNCGELKHITLQSDKNICRLNFFKDVDTFAVGCDSSKLPITINRYFEKSGYTEKVKNCLEQLIKEI